MALVTLLPTSVAPEAPSAPEMTTSLEPEAVGTGDEDAADAPSMSVVRVDVASVALVDDDPIVDGPLPVAPEPETAAAVLLLSRTSLTADDDEGGGRPENRKFLMLFDSSRQALLIDDIGDDADWFLFVVIVVSYGNKSTTKIRINTRNAWEATVCVCQQPTIMSPTTYVTVLTESTDGRTRRKLSAAYGHLCF